MKKTTGLKLVFDSAANRWSEGFPLGNGSLGAVIVAGGESETWHLTEATYWSGRPERTPSRSQGKADLERMRERFFAGDYEGGERLVERALMPDKGNFGTNVAMCDARFAFGHAATSLRRELDLEEAIASIAYESADVRYGRETFASHPGAVVASKLTADKPGAISFVLGLEGRSNTFSATEGAGGDTLVFAGSATESVHSDGSCGVNGAGAIKVVVRGGTMRAEEGKLVVEGADEAFVYFAASTDYGLGEDVSWKDQPAERVARAAVQGYEALKREHIADYRSLFARVNVSLGNADAEERPEATTSERMARLREGGASADAGLFALFYQYGRYLTISGSRQDSRLPMHLQGIWNDGEACAMAWSCDYHLDVNTQMNYYPAQTANLADCHEPLFRFVERLAEAGKVAARDFYGCEGWVAHVFTNAWGFAAPGWHYSWGLNVTGGLWLAAQLKEHYDFSGDDAFLASTAYPVLKSAATFYLDYMTVDPATGYLVTGPSNSPENSFYPSEGSGESRTMSMGSVMDTMLVRELFSFCIEASLKLGDDEAFRGKLAQALALLAPLAVGSEGQLQEWLKDYGEAQPDHRHLSHLYGLYPGNEITPDGTPELAQAARTTLDRRQRGSTLEDVEFTLALFAAGRARLRDGDRARDHLAYLIGELCFDNLLTFSKPGIAGAEAYIFVADGNFGGAAAFAEMLLQSHAGEIHVLPAIPADWPNGSFEGLRARGGAEIDVAWSGGRLVSATVRASKPLRTKLRYEDLTVDISLEEGRAITFDGSLTARA
ncbi:glycoside hydrolase N-terminal domain-containing protein [Cohnella sp. GCM10027633]|uniref:glycoside hydrolase family 95 protein n=1 Tax=unclassified Cohnella TaxID=2636738 RepID=UPI003632BDF4